MPRVSKLKSAENRCAITAAASRLFRERGLRSVSVDDLMAAAGLTHGGFYGHFASKDALAAEACALAFEASAARWRLKVADTDGEAARTALVTGFLSAKSRSNAASACPTVGLATDVAREPADAPIRAAYAEGVEKLLALWSSLPCGKAGAREEALADLSTLVGTLLLARATNGRKLSDEFLAAGRRRMQRMSA